MSARGARTLLLATLSGVLAPWPCTTHGLQSFEFDAAGQEIDQAHEKAHEKAQRSGAFASRVRSIEVQGRWADRVDLPLALCDELTPTSISAAMNALRETITGGGRTAFSATSQGEIEVLLIDVDYDTAPGDGAACGGERTVGVTLRPYHLRLSLEKVGDNVLPIPRSPVATIAGNVPPVLSVLRPRFGVVQDRAFGTGVGAAVDVDLLESGPRKLELQGQGTESVDRSFYRTDAAVRYRERINGPLLRELRIGLSAEGAREPLGSAEQEHHAANVDAGLTLKLVPGTRLALDTGWRYTEDRALSHDVVLSRSDSHLFVNRALLDSLVPAWTGFLRAGIWQSSGRTEDNGDTYHHLVGRAGYAQEIRITPGRNLGLEVIAGAGKLWGDAPPTSRFFGGSMPGQFMYDSPSSRSMLDMPRGPLIRSFGQAQAGLGGTPGAQGGDAFWHFNVNLALPVSGWSRPLIPDAETGLTDDEGKPVTLKRILRTQVDKTGPAMLSQTFVKQGMSQEQAKREADRALAEVQPAVRYIVDDATLFAVRPLLLFDAAGLSGGVNGASAKWTAVGLGLSVSVVTARLEAGYMRTLSGPTPDGQRGAAFLRLVFQNLF